MHPSSLILTPARGNVTANVAPSPSPGLIAWTVPPCISTRCLTMANPSPSPPWLLVIELSACRNRSNMYGRNSGLMPSPVSVTAIWTCESFRL